MAMKTGGITLVKSDLRGIVKARRLSQRTRSNIRENLFFAFFYNPRGVPLAAGVLFPFFGLLLNPMIAAAAMSDPCNHRRVKFLQLRCASETELPFWPTEKYRQNGTHLHYRRRFSSSTPIEDLAELPGNTEVSERISRKLWIRKIDGRGGIPIAP